MVQGAWTGNEDGGASDLGALGVTDITGFRNPYATVARARELIASEFRGESNIPGGAIPLLIRLRAGLVAGAPITWGYDHPDPVHPVRALLKEIVRLSGYDFAEPYWNQLQYEQEGSALILAGYVLDPAATAGQGVRVEFTPAVRLLRNYRIVTQIQPLLDTDPEPESGSPFRIRGVHFTKDAQGAERIVDASRFEFLKLHGLRSDFDPPPPIQPILPLLKMYEDIHLQKRANLAKFAKTILHAHVDRDAKASRIAEVLAKVARFFGIYTVFKAQLQYIEPSGNAARALAEEQDYLLQDSWGKAGVPAIYSGLIRLAKNQATPRETKSQIQLHFQPLRNLLMHSFLPSLMAKGFEALFRGHIALDHPDRARELYDAAGRVRPELQSEFVRLRQAALNKLGIADYAATRLYARIPPITEEEILVLQESLSRYAQDEKISARTYADLAPLLDESEVERLAEERAAAAPDLELGES
jgi:hypothetical protein